ncbi:uncharacterized protein LOC124871921 [Girardinichthys multiradiatus]|uniref:uncharacterized protein LOC124871921 n=1 Tax=Girardinichthys multiradiatus TaxID=208333 RepID=UPI001FAD95E2|nr:uncharacterized protein LOC124871921 [Girardinichthys multiradiatus]
MGNTRRTPISHRLSASVQSRLFPLNTIQTPSTGSLTHTPTLRRATRHVTTPNKMEEWSLTIRKKWLIVGDWNVVRFPQFEAENLQVDGFPGARWRHAEALLRKAMVDCPVEKIILSFGINNRSQRDKRSTIREIKNTLTVANIRFPQATIYIPEINFSTTLPNREQTMLRHINGYIRTYQQHIPAMTEDFQTEGDGIHWTHATASLMLAHWVPAVLLILLKEQSASSAALYSYSKGSSGSAAILQGSSEDFSLPSFNLLSSSLSSP